MNRTEAKTIRKFAQLTGLQYKVTKHVYERGTDEQKTTDLLEMKNTISAILKRKEETNNGKKVSV